MHHKLLVHTFKSESLLKKFHAITLDEQGTFRLDKNLLGDAESCETSALTVTSFPSKSIFTFQTSGKPLVGAFKNMTSLFSGLDFTYEYFDIPSLVAGVYMTKANAVLVEDSYGSNDPKMTKSVHGLIHYMVHSLQKNKAVLQREFSQELFKEKLNSSKITFQFSPLIDSVYSTVSLSSAYSNTIFTQNVPSKLLLHFEKDPYMTLNKIIHFNPEPFKQLECYALPYKSFSIREVEAILVYFDLTSDGFSWENDRNFFNVEAAYYGFKQGKKKSWQFQPLTFEKMKILLQESQNGHYLTARAHIDFTNSKQIISFAIKCGFALYNGLFYLSLKDDVLL